MNLSSICFSFAVVFGAASTVSFGYEVATHAALTNAGLGRSNLSTPGNVLKRELGILPWVVQEPSQPFTAATGSFYFNFSTSQVFGMYLV